MQHIQSVHRDSRELELVKLHRFISLSLECFSTLVGPRKTLHHGRARNGGQGGWKAPNL
ncbi:MAG: hypothetical protein V4731_09800 [Pseudomonadota bacterium]